MSSRSVETYCKHDTSRVHCEMTRTNAFVASMSVTPVRTTRDFAAALPRRPAPEELSVFSFVKRDCRACRYAAAHFKRMADELGKGSVRFFEMDVSHRDTQTLCRDLGVAAVPAFHFYAFRDGKDSGVGCLDTVVGPTNVAKVRQRVSEYSSKDFDIAEYSFA